MWHTLRAAGRAWPKLDDDPVIDYMVMEAVHIKTGKEQEAAQKEAEKEAARKKFRADREHLKEFQ
jgi:hypothetical protein